MTEENSKSLTVALPLSKFKPHTYILSLQTYFFTKFTRRLIFSYETLKDCEVERGRRRADIHTLHWTVTGTTEVNQGNLHYVRQYLLVDALGCNTSNEQVMGL
jgi:hypothetical protein